MSATQFLLSGPSYLRIWQLEPLKELDAFFSLKQEKSLKMIPGIHLMQYSEFLAGCATAKMSDDLQGNMMKSSAPQPAPVLPKISPEEDFLIIWVFCRDGTFFKFKIKERTGKTSLMEAGNIIRLLEFQDDNGTWDSQGEESAFSSRLPPKPSAVEITCVARWGLASGFILGGTCGYLGLLRFKPDEKVETLGPYWVNDVYGSEGVKWLSDYKEEDIPKKHRNTSAKTDNKFRIPDVLLLTATAREDPTADTTPTVRGQAQPKKEDVLKMYGFSVHKRDQAQQVKPVSLLFEFHGDGVLSMAAAPKGTKTLYSIGNDTALKSWTYPELSASATLTAAKATAQTGAAAVSVKTSSSSSASSSSSRAFSMEHSKIFEYDIPIQVAVHPNGLCLAVVFLDRLRLYFSCFDEIRQVWDMPLKQPSCCAFSHSGDYLAVSAMNFVLLLDIHNPKGTLVLAQYTGHLSVISQILFSVDDTLLMTCGRDGCIYGWEVASGNRIIEHVSKGSVYVAFQYDESAQEVIAVSREGDFRLIKKSTGACHLQLSHCFFNCMLLAARRNFLACGTVFGSLRVFEWPLREVDPQSNRAASTLGSGASSTSVSRDMIGITPSRS
ncbi:unnamed protein product [Amoebophrya sp. A25]|nr:unnamed protein product [Amoebophrya sp. A25]|eukprot:GSA25T00002609001.1